MGHKHPPTAPKPYRFATDTMTPHTRHQHRHLWSTVMKLEVLIETPLRRIQPMIVVGFRPVVIYPLGKKPNTSLFIGRG